MMIKKNNTVPSRIAFDHKFFQSAENGHFRMSEQGDLPVFAFKISGENQEIVLSFSGIKKEFSLEDSDDSRMLDFIQEALRFIKTMRIGDKLPPELSTREASWSIEPHHVTIARNRLTVQLITWISGEEKIVNDLEKLRKIIDDPKIQNKINQALDEAAARLGGGNQNRERVLELLESLADELAHIEALRQEFEKIVSMRKKTEGLLGCYTNELSVSEQINPVIRLLGIAIKEYRKVFDELDANICEIVSVMRNIERHTEYIRHTRDYLYCRLMAWDEIFSRWGEIQVRRHRDNENLLRDTYSFLAPRFMPEDEWILLSKLHENRSANSKTEMRW